jgi:protein phosphatase
MPDLTPEQKEELPRNVITRALGMTESVQVDISSDDPKVGDVYVLCSDGLSGMISDDEIAEIVTANTNPEEAATALIARANQHGGEDNVTAVVARVAE